MITIDDVKLLKLNQYTDSEGSLVPVESNLDIPFKIERIFYVYGVHNQTDRGEHGHYKTEQILICLNGNVQVLCDDGKNKREWKLDNPTEALYIPNLIWDEQVYLTPDSILLVIANTKYDESDYITSYEQFRRIKNE
jgi:dTDP-4-dehydrorhamnose 3,5-epimerase-like enzyme|tara:strand:+ start:4223 stop:4633 length:411 start_codon:yes stop_codon:yes gene_type:complete